MGLNEYQAAAIKTALFTKWPDAWMRMAYIGLKMNGEAGEVAEHIGKMQRDDNGVITRERFLAITKELGDVLWYVSAMANELGIPLEEVAEINLQKLADRAARGVIKGSGSDR